MWLSFVRNWWRRPYPVSLPGLRLVLYTRTGCHLCEDAERLLQRARQRYRFSLDSMDVDLNPALAERFGERVPVVEVNGKVRFWGRINPALLERLLRSEARRTASGRRQPPE